MKKRRLFSMIVAVGLTLALTACKDNSTNSDAGSGHTQQNQSAAIDVDLTQLSSTVVYAEVYNMMTSPEDYIGKMVKIEGTFSIYQAVDENGDAVPDGIYFACLIADATSCCSQGIEFVLAGDYTYPDDYPELGSQITVTGKFRTYEENGYQYIQLADAVLT